MNVKRIYFKQENDNLKLLFEFIDRYLFFDSYKFMYIDYSFSITKDWSVLEYKSLSENLMISNIKEDELTSYFVEFSNKDVLYVYQMIDGDENIKQGFEIVTFGSNDYNELVEYMNEDWIEEVVVS